MFLDNQLTEEVGKKRSEEAVKLIRLNKMGPRESHLPEA